MICVRVPTAARLHLQHVSEDLFSISGVGEVLQFDVHYLEKRCAFQGKHILVPTQCAFKALLHGELGVLPIDDAWVRLRGKGVKTQLCTANKKVTSPSIATYPYV